MKYQSKKYASFFVTALIFTFAVITTVSAQVDNSKIQSYLEQVLLTRGLPGLSAAVAVDGEIVFSSGSGYADLENYVPATGSTVYRIASISKPIAGIGVMQLVEKGVVNLQDEIQKYVPQMPRKNDPVTLWHLMTHTSGIRHYKPGEFGRMEHYQNLADALAIFKDDDLLFKPGTNYQYTTYGFNLLQGVVETASEMDFEQYLRRNIFIPAGMLSAGLEIKSRLVYNRAKGYIRDDNGRIVNAPYTDTSIKYAAGGMIASVEDLVKLFVALDKGLLLKPETVQDMYKVHYVRRDNADRGLAWSVNNDLNGYREIAHSGGAMGFNSMLVNYPDEKIVVAVISNQSSAGIGNAARTIAQYYLGSK